MPLSPSQRPPTVRALGDYHFLASLGRDPLMETWEARAPDGGARLVRLVYGIPDRVVDDARRRLAGQRHSALALPILVSAGPGCVAVVSEHLPETARTRQLRWKLANRPAPVQDILGWLEQAAAALDAWGEADLPHLGLHPGCLGLGEGRVRILEFGLVALLLLPAGKPLPPPIARFAAPELRTKPGRACDVFALATVAQQLAGGPEAVPENWREPLNRALDDNPGRRFRRCADLVAALHGAGDADPADAAEWDEQNEAAPAFGHPEPTPTVEPEPEQASSPVRETAAVESVSRPLPEPAVLRSQEVEDDATKAPLGAPLECSPDDSCVLLGEEPSGSHPEVALDLDEGGEAGSQLPDPDEARPGPISFRGHEALQEDSVVDIAPPPNDPPGVMHLLEELLQDTLEPQSPAGSPVAAADSETNTGTDGGGFEMPEAAADVVEDRCPDGPEFLTRARVPPYCPSSALDHTDGTGSQASAEAWPSDARIMDGFDDLEMTRRLDESEGGYAAWTFARAGVGEENLVDRENRIPAEDVPQDQDPMATHVMGVEPDLTWEQSESTPICTPDSESYTEILPELADSGLVGGRTEQTTSGVDQEPLSQEGWHDEQTSPHVDHPEERSTSEQEPDALAREFHSAPLTVEPLTLEPLAVCPDLILVQNQSVERFDPAEGTEEPSDASPALLPGSESGSPEWAPRDSSSCVSPVSLAHALEEHVAQVRAALFTPPEADVDRAAPSDSEVAETLRSQEEPIGSVDRAVIEWVPSPPLAASHQVDAAVRETDPVEPQEAQTLERDISDESGTYTPMWSGGSGPADGPPGPSSGQPTPSVEDPGSWQPSADEVLRADVPRTARVFPRFDCRKPETSTPSWDPSVTGSGCSGQATRPCLEPESGEPEVTRVISPLWEPGAGLPQFPSPPDPESREGSEDALALPWDEVLAGRNLLVVRGAQPTDVAEPLPEEPEEGPKPDREALARALAAQVAAALFDETGKPDSSAHPQPEPPLDSRPQERFRPSPDLLRLLEEAAMQMPEPEPEAWVQGEDGREQLECHFPGTLPPNITLSAFDGFRRQWNAEVQSSDANGVVFHVGPSAGFWQRWLGRSAGLLIDLRWSRGPENPIPRISVIIRPAGRSTDDSLRELAPLLLDSLRVMLHVPSNRRSEQRLIWPFPVQVTFLLSNGAVSGTLQGVGKDLNRLGLGLFIPRILPGSRVRLELTSPTHPEPVRVSGCFIRVHRSSEQWFEAAVLFQNDDLEDE